MFPFISERLFRCECHVFVGRSFAGAHRRHTFSREQLRGGQTSATSGQVQEEPAARTGEETTPPFLTYCDNY